MKEKIQNAEKSSYTKVLDSKWFGVIIFIGIILFVFVAGRLLYLDFTNKIHLSSVLRGVFLFGLFAILAYPLKRVYNWLIE